MYRILAPPPPITLAGVLVVEADRCETRDLHLAGGRVAAEPPRGAAFLDARGLAAFPGLLNAHDHLPLNALPRPDAIRREPSAYAWIDAFQPLFDDPAMRRALAVPIGVRAAHGALKNLLAGVTTVAHHDPWLPEFELPGFPVRVVEPYGWSHSLGLADRYGPPVLESFRATPLGRPWFIHLAEGTDEDAASELARLDALGALDARSVLVHGVGFASDDVARVVAAGAAVVWCPASNLTILGATLDPRPLAAARRLALGTDSRLSGGDDVLAELRTAREASGLSPRALLRLVTADAAALLREEGAGGLSPGMRADLVLLRANGDPYEALVDARRADLVAVARGGRPVVADPALASWFELARVAPRSALLDGRPKLVAASLSAEAAALEPGLTLL
jgi:cytosine/adenosine deaminase-related metal-dependent hydrolase